MTVLKLLFHFSKSLFPEGHFLYYMSRKCIVDCLIDVFVRICNTIITVILFPILSKQKLFLQNKIIKTLLKFATKLDFIARQKSQFNLVCSKFMASKLLWWMETSRLHQVDNVYCLIPWVTIVIVIASVKQYHFNCFMTKYTRWSVNIY